MTLSTTNGAQQNGHSTRSAVARVVGRGPQSEIVLDDELPFEALEQGLRAYLARNPGWFEGAKVTLNIGKRVLNTEQVNGIKSMLDKEFKITIGGLYCGPEMLDLLVSEKEISVPVEVAEPSNTRGVFGDMEWLETMMVRGTCRSGTTIHNNGNLIVLGDVNPGAELTADGDIVVFGRLAGRAHAGVNGDTEATIMALPIDAAQVRIGNFIRIEHTEPGEAVGKRASSAVPSIARVEGDVIVIEPYVARSIWRQQD